MYEMSANHTASGRSATKDRPSRLGAIGRSWRLFVVWGLRRWPLWACRPMSRISRSIRRRAWRRPSRRSSAWMRGRHRPAAWPQRCGRYARATRRPPRLGSVGLGSRAARRKSQRRLRRRPGTASQRHGWPARLPQRQTWSRDPPSEKSRSFPEDLDFLFEPLDLTPETLGLGLLGFAGGERLIRTPAEGVGRDSRRLGLRID